MEPEELLKLVQEFSIYIFCVDLSLEVYRDLIEYLHVFFIIEKVILIKLRFEREKLNHFVSEVAMESLVIVELSEDTKELIELSTCILSLVQHLYIIKYI